MITFGDVLEGHIFWRDFDLFQGSKLGDFDNNGFIIMALNKRNLLYYVNLYLPPLSIDIQSIF